MSCHDHLPPIDRSKVSSVSILAAEHDVILQTLTCLELMAAEIQEGSPLPASSAKKALEVLKLFADRCHHGKEEDILFPALEAIHGVEFGPTQVMRSDHVQGRKHIAEMTRSVEENNAQDFSYHAKAYCELLRDHIYKENEILFRIAQDCLSEVEEKHILQKYREVEHEDMGNGTHERLLDLANEIADTYHVAKASDDPETMGLLLAVCGCAKATLEDTANPWPEFKQLARKVAGVHGENYIQTGVLAEIVSIMADLTPEKRTEQLPIFRARIDELTNHFTPWEGSCGSVHALYQGLEQATLSKRSA